jgi:hypothetical protein
MYNTVYTTTLKKKHTHTHADIITVVWATGHDRSEKNHAVV